MAPTSAVSADVGRGAGESAELCAFAAVAGAVCGREVVETVAAADATRHNVVGDGRITRDR